MAEPLSEQQVRAALAELPGWEADGDTITKTYAFAHFREAVSFIVRIAFAAEAANHHPELWNVYNRVRVTLATHDAGNRVTAKDVALAGEIEHMVLAMSLSDCDRGSHGPESVPAPGSRTPPPRRS